MYNTIANKYLFKYNGSKITLLPMTTAKIFKEYIIRAQRRKNEPFRKEWSISKSVQNEQVALPVGTNIL